MHACRRAVPGNEIRFNLEPREIVNKIHVGDFISIDFNSVLVQVVARENEDLILRVLNGGQVGRNKAVTIEREIILPPLSKKDTQAIEIGKSLGLSHFALSFANRPSDVEMIRKLTDSNTFIISKIESYNAFTESTSKRT